MRWLTLAVLGLLLTLLQYLLAPLLALWPVRLPRWLGWFQTVDFDLMGDGGHWRRWAGRSAYLQRLAWLLRNPTDGWDYRWSVFWRSGDPPPIQSGDPQTSNRPGHAGFCFARLGNAWMLYWIWRWPGQRRCVRVYLGWKLMGAVHGQTGYYPLVCSINPFMGWE